MLKTRWLLYTLVEPASILLLGGNIQNDALSPAGEEFVITDPYLPDAWPNLIGGAGAVAEIDQTGQGQLAVRLSSGVFPVIENNSPGRIVYIRDNDSGQYWSVGTEDNERYQCRHGLGYTTIETTVDGIGVSWTIFIPENGSLEIWQVKVANQGEKKRRLSIYWLVDFAVNSNEPNYTTTFSNNAISVHGRNKKDPVYFLAASKDVSSFETVRSTFFGPGHGFHDPIGVIEGKSSRSLAQGEPLIGVMQKSLTLGPKVVLSYELFVGAFQKTAGNSATKAIQPFTKAGAVTAAFERITTSHKSDLQHHRIRGLGDFDRYHNGFLNYQNLVSRQWPEQSIGSPVTNVVSLSRAIRAGLPYYPAVCRSQLDTALEMVMKDGRVLSGWSSDSAELDNLGDISDSLLLAELAVEYLKETGQTPWLHEQRSYYDGGSGTVLEHLTRLVEFVIGHQQRQVLVANDRELSGVTSKTVCLLIDLVALHTSLNDHHLSRKYQDKVVEYISGVNKRLWQGPYYAWSRSVDSGLPTKNDPQNFDLAAQVAAITSGIAEGKTKRIISAIKKQFPRLVPNIWPPFPQRAENVLSEAVPGHGQNGSIDVSLVCELAEAAAISDETDYAWHLLSQIASSFHQPEFLNNNKNFTAQFNTGGFGSAASLTRAVQETVLGIQPTLLGLRINPHLPASWRQVEISRRFRGADYHIRIQNPLRVTSGVDRIVVDGIRIVGNTIRPFSAGVHFVEVSLG